MTAWTMRSPIWRPICASTWPSTRSATCNRADIGVPNFIGNKFAIALGAITHDGKPTDYASPDASLLVTAPGGVADEQNQDAGFGIVSADASGALGYNKTDGEAGNCIFQNQGTTHSQPMVAAIAALMLVANPKLGFRDVPSILALTARKTDASNTSWGQQQGQEWNLGGKHISRDFGYGLVAAAAAVRLAEHCDSGIELIDGIGSTELFHIFISADEAHAKPGATGMPVPGYRTCVMDEQGRELPRGQVGRLAVQGPTGCKYLADERQAAYVQNRWNLTGDAYLVDDDGQFVYQARTDDMIISGGYNIAGPEVEGALLLHPAVAECGVVGQPDDARGQIVKAYVVLKPGHAADEAMAKALQDFCKQTIAPYKYPREVAFRDVLPRTETGKLQRFRLRDG